MIKNNEKINRLLLIVLALLTTFAITINPLKVFNETNKEKQTKETLKSEYIPNDPTWYKMGKHTMYVDGYTPFYNFIGSDGTIDVEGISNSFTYNDSKDKHHPKAAQSYQSWFTGYKAEPITLGQGGSENDAFFTLELKEPPVNVVDVQYYVEEVAINKSNFYAQNGSINRISFNELTPELGTDVIEDILNTLLEHYDVPKWVIELLENMKYIFEHISDFQMPEWTTKPPVWWLILQGKYNLPDWPSQKPEHWEEFPIILSNLISSVIQGSLNGVIGSIASNILLDFVWNAITAAVPPPFDLIPLLIHKLLSFGIVWKVKEDLNIEVNEINGSFIKGSNHNLENGQLLLEPNVKGIDPISYETLFEFNNNIFGEDKAHKNKENIKIKYFWRERSKTIEFKLEGINDFKSSAILGGDWNFLNAIDIDYDEEVVYVDSNYSLTNDVFGDINMRNEYFDKTQNNFFTAGVDNGNNKPYLPEDESGNYNPFFTKNNTYRELERYILDNKLIVTRDRLQDIDSSNFEIEFYDEDNSLINKDSYLDTSIINFKLLSTGYEGDISGESDVLTYEIPFIGISNINVENNIFNYDEYTSFVFDNESNSNWEYDTKDNTWVLNTNQLISFDASYYNGVQSIYIDYPDAFDYNVTLDLNNPNAQDIKIPNYQQGYNQVLNAYRTNVSIKDLHSKDSRFKGVNFAVDYYSKPSFDTLDIRGKDSSIIQTDMKGYDFDNNGIITGNEIYDSISTTESIFIKSDIEISKYKLTNKGWEIREKGNSFTNDTNGIYAYSTIDKYGNNKFIVIENEDDPNDLKLVSYKDTKEYSKCKEIFLEQETANIEKWNSFTINELRYINLLIYSQTLPDIYKSLIKNPLIPQKLSLVTNEYEENKYEFNEVTIANHEKISMKKNLEREIEEQMKSRGYTPNMYSIKWINVKDNELISNKKSKLEYSIIPNGYWNSINHWESSFDIIEYKSIEEFTPNIDKLEYITNAYSDGVKFNEKVVNHYGEEISLKDSLDNEIKKELISFGIEEKDLIGINIVWSIDDNQIINYGDDLSFTINAETLMVKGKITNWVNSKTRIDLSKYTLDEGRLSEVTNNYFNGSSWNLDWTSGEVSTLRQDLEKEIYKQLALQGIMKEQVNIIFLDEFGNVVEDSYKVENGDVIKYKITSASSKFEGSTEGEFIVDTFERLDDLNILKYKLLEITNHYEDKTDFKIVKKELDEYVTNSIKNKGLELSKVNIEWYADDEIQFSSLITLEITSNDTHYIKGKYNITFSSLAYFDLYKFNFEKSNIQKIFDESADSSSMFLDLREKAEIDIYNQLSEQGYNLSVIDLTWDVGDQEVMNTSRTINLTIKGKAKFIVHGELTYSFEFKGSDSSKDKSFLMIIFIVTIILFALLAILAIIVSLIELKKKRKILNND